MSFTLDSGARFCANAEQIVMIHTMLSNESGQHRSGGSYGLCKSPRAYARLRADFLQVFSCYFTTPVQGQLVSEEFSEQKTTVDYSYLQKYGATGPTLVSQ